MNPYKREGEYVAEMLQEAARHFLIAISKVKVGKVAVPLQPYDVFHLYDLKTFECRQYHLLLFRFRLPVVAYYYFIAVK